MPLLQTIVASTRPTRLGPKVADWFIDQAKANGKFTVEKVDLAEVNLPIFDEPEHPRFKKYAHDHTKAWSATVDRADAFVVVTPEYDHGPPASLVNAFQYLNQEWAYKPLGIVSYGGVSAGTRSLHLIKGTAVGLKMMPMFEAVSIPFFNKYIDDETGLFDPGDVQVTAVNAMLDEMLRWTEALAVLRKK